jgi:hypothetical protein
VPEQRKSPAVNELGSSGIVLESFGEVCESGCGVDASVLARRQPSKDCEIVLIGTAAETSKKQGSLAPSLLDADWINYLFIKNLEP